MDSACNKSNSEPNTYMYQLMKEVMKFVVLFLDGQLLWIVKLYSLLCVLAGEFFFCDIFSLCFTHTKTFGKLYLMKDFALYNLCYDQNGKLTISWTSSIMFAFWKFIFKLEARTSVILSICCVLYDQCLQILYCRYTDS